MIEVKSIIHRFKDNGVLEHIDFTFPEAQVTAVLGRSGSGKTTLLQILNGMIKPTSGSVAIAGVPIDYQHLPALRMTIGYVIQQAGLFPHLTILENISVLGRVLNHARETQSKRVAQLMELVQLPRAYEKKFPYELSGGEQQRVGLCRAMYLNPPILLMDEPFASLDIETKQTIYAHIHQWQTLEPRTIIMVTHDWNEALQLADKFLWLEKGHVKQQGDKAKLEAAKAEYLASR